MYQILKKLLLVLLCLSLLSSFVFAGDVMVSPIDTVTASASINATVGISTKVAMVTTSEPSADLSTSTNQMVHFKSATIAMGAGTCTFVLKPVPLSSPFTADTSTEGASVSVSTEKAGTYSIATVTVISEGSTSPVLVSFSDSNVQQYNTNASVSGFTFTPASDPGPVDPSDPGVPSGSMNGIQGWRYALSSAYQWETYNQYIGVRKIMYSYSFQGPDGGSNWNSSEVEGEEILYDMAVAISVNGYKWKIDPVTKDIVFYGYDGGMAKTGSWLDMVFRYLTYDYYWGTRLWSDNVSGSWFGSISDSFGYLNFRVNQILSVLANDEDLSIKDATTPERDWVKNYFNGSGDKADSGKYDKLNDTGSAFKDTFAGAPDSSIADGFTAVNDNGYDFWSQGVSDDINGNASSSSGASRAPAYVPPEQRIIDAYSENWAQIVGGYYD